ncbi:unnamed protein product, partial [Musa textilis]
MRPGIAGAVFGPGWRFLVNAVVCSVVRVRRRLLCLPVPSGFPSSTTSPVSPCSPSP